MPPADWRYEVVFDQAATRDLKDIYSYVRERAGPRTAESFTTKLYQFCRGFEHTPERGTRRDNLRPRLRTVGYRRRATILFEVDRDRRQVLILGIYYGGRNYQDDFADDDQE
jgi:toxin ParE1/3/4